MAETRGWVEVRAGSDDFEDRDGRAGGLGTGDGKV